MALFFHTFRHNTVASAMGIPFFPLSKTELNHQSKYEEDDDFPLLMSLDEVAKTANRFEAMDLNRTLRKSVLMIPSKELLPENLKDTEKRSNQADNVNKKRRETQKSLHKSFKKMNPSFRRTKSEVDEVQACLDLAKEDFRFVMASYFRRESGELMASTTKSSNEVSSKLPKRSSLVIRKTSEPMTICDTTKLNLGRVHYQLAVLHGIGRFPEVVGIPSNNDHSNDNRSPSHDAFSVLFHLSHAASLRCVPACLALGRILAGLGTCVSDLLEALVPIDFEGAKCLLKRAMESEHPANLPKVSAGCILYQIYTDEAFVARGGIQSDNDDCGGDVFQHTVVSDIVLTNLLEKILDLMQACDLEREVNVEFKERSRTHSHNFRAGDKVEGNYFLEGNYYPGIVESVSNNTNNGDNAVMITVKYDDDGTVESLSSDNVRAIVPPTATQTALGGPLTDEEAGFGVGSGDEAITLESYQLRADLAKLVETSGDHQKASKLYEQAAHEAMQANKMKVATEWSLKASNLMQ